MRGKTTIGVALVLAGLLVPPLVPGAAAETRTAGTPSATIWHLGHSGVAVETRGHLLVFDYAEDRPVGGARRGLASGVVEPAEVAGKRVVVFISHEHHDHFWPDAIGWLDGISDLRFVVSPEVAHADRRFARRDGVIDVVPPDADRRIGDLRVRTLPSADSGVAFLVDIGGLTIYHSGDHAAFNWGREAAAPVRFVRDRLRPLDGESIDIAFQVADPRLSDAGWGGAVAFAEALQPRLLVPIHLWGDYSRIPALAEELRQTDFAGEFWAVARRGESRTYTPADAAFRR